MFQAEWPWRRTALLNGIHSQVELYTCTNRVLTVFRLVETLGEAAEAFLHDELVRRLCKPLGRRTAWKHRSPGATHPDHEG